MRVARWCCLPALMLAATAAITFWSEAAAMNAATDSRGAVSPRPITPRGNLSPEESATIELFEHSRDSVVFISTKAAVVDFWSRNVMSVPRGTGSGFIWDDAGHVVTNFHVIEGATEASVKLVDGRTFKATLAGASPEHDIAVLKIGINFKGPRPVPIGTSGDLKVGQRVYAIGNPFGLDWTLTSGIVSALNRSLVEENGNPLEHLIQTDAPINPGNSGGPLLDSAGRLVGINTAIYSPSGAAAGVGFAVPVDTVNRVVPELIRTGHYRRPAIGIQVDEGFNERLESISGIEGVFVLRVAPGSAAEAAGLKAVRVTRAGEIIGGDVIVSVNARKVNSVSRYLVTLDDYEVGDIVRLGVRRGDRLIEIPVRLQAGG
ncbi:MAG TPA: trypsin-like peptidase domain-containing protein [Steroidobacteraceae bacterium]|nr:trypsin-like peptidase domain-containing protein [Steroidobacteraceae bacterium]